MQQLLGNLVTFMFLMTSVLAWANPSHKRDMVIDNVDMLSPSMQQRLEQRLLAYHNQTSIEIVIYIAPSFDRLNLEEYGKIVFDGQRLGRRGDPGILLLVSGGQAYIATDQSMAPYLTSNKITGIVNVQVQPLLQRGDRSRAILTGVDAIMAALIDSPLVRHSVNASRPQPWVWLTAFGVSLAVAGCFLTLGFRGLLAGRLQATPKKLEGKVTTERGLVEFPNSD